MFLVPKTSRRSVFGISFFQGQIRRVGDILACKGAAGRVFPAINTDHSMRSSRLNGCLCHCACLAGVLWLCRHAFRPPLWLLSLGVESARTDQTTSLSPLHTHWSSADLSSVPTPAKVVQLFHKRFLLPIHGCYCIERILKGALQHFFQLFSKYEMLAERGRLTPPVL